MRAPICAAASRKSFNLATTLLFFGASLPLKHPYQVRRAITGAAFHGTRGKTCRQTFPHSSP